MLADDGRGWSPVPGLAGWYHSDKPAGMINYRAGWGKQALSGGMGGRKKFSKLAICPFAHRVLHISECPAQLPSVSMFANNDLRSDIGYVPLTLIISVAPLTVRGRKYRRRTCVFR